MHASRKTMAISLEAMSQSRLHNALALLNL
jgi:hypothetical protein